MGIISKEKTKNAVAPQKRMEHIRKRYNYSDDVPENDKEDLSLMFQRFPEMLQAISLDEQGQAVIVAHVVKLRKVCE